LTRFFRGFCRETRPVLQHDAHRLLSLELAVSCLDRRVQVFLTFFRMLDGGYIQKSPLRHWQACSCH
jgi:hypothetical protein